MEGGKIIIKFWGFSVLRSTRLPLSPSLSQRRLDFRNFLSPPPPMAPKNLVSRKRRPPQDEVRTLGNKQSDDSDSDGFVSPKKPKFVTPLKLPGPESGPESEPIENGSACSSPSASGFIIAPSRKPQAEKKTTKKKAFGSKVFSEDDVISLLKGLVVFWANGKNNKWAEFHLFVKDNLGNQLTRTQVSEKIRALKKKFDAYSERAKANGGRIDLSDPHESAVFELSKALWGEENRQMVKNGDEEANAVSTEKEKEKEDGGEKDEGSKKRKKRKQVTDNGEENEKSKKAEQGVEGLKEEGDVHDAANTILSIRKLVDENGEGNKKARKKKKKTKQVDELDEKKELVMEEVQVEGNDEGNKISSKEEQVDGVSERNKKTKKAKKTELVDECCEEKKSIGEHKEVDEDAEKSMKEVDHHDEEGKRELLKEGKRVDEHEQQEKKSKKNKKVDGRDKKKGIAKPEDDHGEENSKPAKEKQEMEIGVDEFQSAFPLLYASYNSSEYPKVAMDTCVRIGRENAQELEEKLREIQITMHRLELKRLDLMSHQRK